MPPIYDDYNDECGPPIIEEEIYYDYNMPPIFDDCNDGFDSYFVEFAPTITNDKDFSYVESNKFSMLVDHDKKVLCDTYIFEFIHVPLKIIMREGDIVSLVSTISIVLSLC